MGCMRALVCLILPPLAVLDRGCGTVIIVTALTILGYVPGVIAALVLNALDPAHPRPVPCVPVSPVTGGCPVRLTFFEGCGYLA